MGMSRLSTVTTAALMGLACLASVAQAEVLSIEGVAPANSSEFVEIQSIAIDGFGGRDGRALGFELEDRLSAISIFDQRYFDVIGGRSAVQPDASLSGNVSAAVEEYETVAVRRICVKRGEKDKCITYKDIEVDCLTRTIDYRAQVRATRYRDGRSIYTEAFPNRHEQTICYGDDQDFPNSESVIRDMISQTANGVRNDLAPREYRQDIRILESRKGMTKADGNYFKAAIKMTKSNPEEACRMWDEAAENGLDHISLSFNRGLCAEQRQDLDSALALYEEADIISPGKSEANEAMRRVNGHQRALDEWELRQSGRLEN
jgi:tetratricopeptide (TPR) repeat protein